MVEPLQPFTTEALQISVDLDAFFGHCTIPEFVSGFKKDIILSITEKLVDKPIKSNYMVSLGAQRLNIKSWPHYHFASVSNELGHIEISIVLRPCDVTAEDIKKKMFAHCLSIRDEGNLKNIDFLLLKCIPFKEEVTAATNCKKLYGSIQNEHLSRLLKFTEDYAEFGPFIKANCWPLFAKEVRNLHLHTVDVHGNPITKSELLGDVLKFNLYSTFKGRVDLELKLPHVLGLTRGLIERSLNASEKPSHVFERYIPTYYSSIDSNSLLDRNRTAFYRCEIRCLYSSVERVLANLASLMVPENFFYYKSDEFFSLLQHNVNRFVNFINPFCLIPPDLNVVSRGIPAESIFKAIFLAGKTSESVLKSKLCKQIIKYTQHPSPASDELFVQLEYIFEEMSVEKKCNMLVKQVNYAPHLTEAQKQCQTFLVKTFFYPPTSLDEIIEKMLKTMMQERKGTDDLSGMLSTTHGDHMRVVNLKSWIRNVFQFKRGAANGMVQTARKNTGIRALFNAMRLRLNMSCDELVVSIVKYMQKCNYQSVPLLKSST